MRKLPLLFILLLLAGSLVAGAAGLPEPELQSARGRVLRIEQASDLPDTGFLNEAFYVEVEILSGPFQGRIVNVFHALMGNPAFDIDVEVGDKIILLIEVLDGEMLEVFIDEHVRDTHVFLLAGVFVLLILLLGGRQGAKSLFSLFVIGVLVIHVLIPLLLRGYSPMLVAMAVSAMAIAVTMFVVGGINPKTTAAILGTVGGILVAGFLAFSVGQMARLTGLSQEEARMLVYIPQGTDFNFQGLLFAAMIIGALGAIMDVGMSVASAMWEIKRVNPLVTGKQLFQSGMNVGRDIMGTMTNTLILAYAGSATSLLLLFQAYEVPVRRIINMDKIATELIRALTGSIGLIAAIPLTALAAAWLVRVGKADGAAPEQQESAD